MPLNRGLSWRQRGRPQLVDPPRDLGEEVSGDGNFGVTTHSTAARVKQQVTEAFPWETAPRYLIRDRNSVYDMVVRARIEAMAIEEMVTVPRSPWQNPYAERVIGSIRRECLDHIIVLSEGHLRCVLFSYLDYDHRPRTHLSMSKDSPLSRPIQPVETGKVAAFPQVGGLLHRYERLAA